MNLWPSSSSEETNTNCSTRVFTTLHGIQTRSSDENYVRPSVCLSVCLSRVNCDKTVERSVQIFSERELMFTFAICRRPSVCLSSVVCLSVTFVHATQPVEIFGNAFAPFNTLVTWRHSGKILRRSSQGNPFIGGLNQTVIGKCSDFGPLRGYISETVQDRR